jgi:tRNA-dihydrouridine synthase 2
VLFLCPVRSVDYSDSTSAGPEIVDKAIIGAERVVLPENGVVQFQKNGRSIWETHPIEKDRLIYQIGSSDPELALKAAKLVENDV